MPDRLVAELFDRRHLAVYRYFRRMTGSHDLAQDLTQELFLRVVRALGAGTQVRSETAFLFQIAHHVWPTGEVSAAASTNAATVVATVFKRYGCRSLAPQLSRVGGLGMGGR